MFVIMTMDRTKPGKEAEVEMQRQKEKRTVPVGVCKDLIQGITKVAQSPTGTVKRLKSRSEISLFCTNLRSTGSAESRNSCNGAGACGVIGTMSERTEST